MCLIYLLSSSFAAYFNEIRSPGLSTGIALRSICGVVSDVGAYGVLLSASFGLAVCSGGGVLVGRLYGLAYCMCARAGVRVMLRIARQAVVAPCTALRYIGNRNGSEITMMRGKQSRGWITFYSDHWQLVLPESWV